MTERRAIQAGLLYCAVVFAVGFVLGAVRVFWVEPLAGEFSSVALEAPLMLAVAWSVCGWMTEHFEVSERLLDRVLMGAVALVFLFTAEIVLALIVQRRSLVEFFASYGQSALLLGLVAQLAFALFPLLRRGR
jgi:hypothetical protein